MTAQSASVITRQNSSTTLPLLDVDLGAIKQETKVVYQLLLFSLSTYPQMRLPVAMQSLGSS